MTQGFYNINISVSVIIQKHKSKIHPGFVMSLLKSCKKYSVTKLLQVTGRAVDLWSA